VTVDVGLIGELLVELRLAENGWRPMRLDARRTAVNADVIAVREKLRVSIQVKATKGFGHSHASDLGFGYSSDFLEGGTVFNGKPGPFVADVVVGVSYDPAGSRFVVLPVALAEQVCARHCAYWHSIPATKRKTGEPGERSRSFPIYLAFKKTRGTHVEHHTRMQRNLLAFEDRWDVLSEPVERLHDPRAWPLLD
jgi:hypothetical protein